jgi:hypothetical protein
MDPLPPIHYLHKLLGLFLKYIYWDFDDARINLLAASREDEAGWLDTLYQALGLMCLKHPAERRLPL